MSARLVVFASGQGSNLQVLLDACKSGGLDARVVGVVSHTPTAMALARAERAGVPGVFVAPPRARESRDAWDAALADRVAAMQPQLIVLAGWLRVLGRAFLDQFPQRVVNIHPALPGELAGLHAIERAWEEAEAGHRRQSGVMVHLAVPEVDAGPVLVSEALPIDVAAGFDAFATAMHALEHRLIVEGVRRAIAATATSSRA